MGQVRGRKEGHTRMAPSEAARRRHLALEQPLACSASSLLTSQAAMNAATGACACACHGESHGAAATHPGTRQPPASPCRRRDAACRPAPDHDPHMIKHTPPPRSHSLTRKPHCRTKRDEDCTAEAANARAPARCRHTMPIGDPVWLVRTVGSAPNRSSQRPESSAPALCAYAHSGSDKP